MKLPWRIKYFLFKLSMIARYIGACFSVALLFSSCATTRTSVATFKAPSLAPLQQAVSRVEQRVSGAKDAAVKLAAATTEPCKTKEWQDAYDALQAELNGAYLSVQNAKDEITAKQGEIDDLTKSANEITEKLANERDAAYTRADKAETSRHDWVKRFWYAAGAAALLAAWVFRGLWIPALAAI
jgi:hypothetical protein